MNRVVSILYFAHESLRNVNEENLWGRSDSTEKVYPYLMIFELAYFGNQRLGTRLRIRIRIRSPAPEPTKVFCLHPGVYHPLKR